MSQYFDQLGPLPIGSLLLAAGAFIVIASAIWIAPHMRQRFRGGPAPVPVAKPFLTNRKHAMLAALERVLPMYRIHAQVSIGALLAADVSRGRRRRASDSDAFRWRIVDFVIVDPVSSSVVALIEMDERLAEPDEDRERDAITSRAGYQTIRISSSDRATVATAQAAVGHLRDAAQSTASKVSRLPVAPHVWPLEGRFNGAR